MPKTIHTPRDELICGKIDHALGLLQAIERGERGVVGLAFMLHHIQADGHPINQWPQRCADWMRAMGYLEAPVK